MGRASAPTRIKLLLLLVSVAMAIAAYWWFDGGRYAFTPRRWGAIVSGRVYRSAQLHRRLIHDTLVEQGIGTIVDMAPDTPGDPDEAAEREAARTLGIERVVVAGLAGDGTGDPAAYVTVLEAMHRAAQGEGKALLIHCAAGTQRSGAATAMYRTLFEGWSGPRAFAEYMAYRGGRRDDGRLPIWLAQHLPAIAAGLVQRGALEAVPDPLPRIGPAPLR